MSFSRNVNHDKMNACHQGHEGNEESIDCNVRQAGTVDYHERSIIGGGPILLMGDSTVYLGVVVVGNVKRYFKT